MQFTHTNYIPLSGLLSIYVCISMYQPTTVEEGNNRYYLHYVEHSTSVRVTLYKILSKKFTRILLIGPFWCNSIASRFSMCNFIKLFFIKLFALNNGVIVH